jgi:DNA-binding Xre family transcriptional regulator
LTDGRIYEMPLSALAVAEDWDESGLASASVIDAGWAVLVRLRSGAEIDFASDFVLHRCEPDYPYFHTRVKPSQLGTRVKAVRQWRNCSLSELARKTGIAEPNLSRLEHNKHMPNFETLQKIARALDVPLRKMLGW